MEFLAAQKRVMHVSERILSSMNYYIITQLVGLRPYTLTGAVGLCPGTSLRDVSKPSRPWPQPLHSCVANISINVKKLQFIQVLTATCIE